MKFCDCRFDVLTNKRVFCENHQKRKQLHRPENQIISPEKILEQGQEIDDPLARALYFLLYCTGARIGEAARFKLLSLKTTPTMYLVSLPLEKKRNKDVPHFRNTPIPRGEKALCCENEMMKEVIAYLNRPEVQGKEYPFWVWGVKNFRPDYMSAYMIRNAHMTTITQIKVKDHWVEMEHTRGLLCHWLRHCRASHCAMKKYYNMTDTQLRLYFDWSKPDMAARYTHLKDKQSLFGL